MSKQSWSITPKKNLGRWSLGLIILMPVLFYVGTSFTESLYENIPAGGTILGDIAARPALALTMLGGMASGIAAFVTGLLAIIKQKDYALLVFISTLIGGLLLLFLSGEVLLPH